MTNPVRKNVNLTMIFMTFVLSGLVLVALCRIVIKEEVNNAIRMLDKQIPIEDNKSKYKALDANITIRSKSNLNCADESDIELARFNKLYDEWPLNQPKAAIYFLVQAKAKRVKKLQRALATLHDNFLKDFDYPIIIFHEESFCNRKSQIKDKNYTSNIFFLMVEFKLPDFITKEQLEFKSCFKYGLGYRHMCRFHPMILYNQPITEKLDFLWRLDDDSVILKPINYDLFHFMEYYQFVYGYWLINSDYGPCVKTLWIATRRYIKKNALTPKFFYEWEYPNIYYNNFEIVNIKKFVTEQYRDFMNYLDHEGGIYEYRWGDAPIKTIAATLFINRNETHHFKDIGYKHKGFSNEGL